MQVHQKVTNKTIRWSSNFTLGYISKENKTVIQKDICTSVSIAVLFIIAKTWKQPINKWMDKCMRLLLSHKLNEIYLILYKKATVLLLICTLYLIDSTIYIFYIDTHLQIFKLELILCFSVIILGLKWLICHHYNIPLFSFCLLIFIYEIDSFICIHITVCCCCSVAKSCLFAIHGLPYSSGSPVLHYLLEIAQIHVHWVSDTI